MDFHSFDMLTIGILAVDTKGKITYLNDAYAAFLEKKKEEVLGQHIRKILPHTHLDHVCQSGIAEIGVWQKTEKGHLFGNRLPIYEEGVLKGAVAELVIESHEALDDLRTKLIERESQIKYLTDQLKTSSASGTIKFIYRSSIMDKIYRNIRKVAPLFDTVLISGETGTGKEVAADMLWRLSNRADSPFIKINCASLPLDLMESELFGYEKGAFTGASPNGKPGKFELADGGVLFLDEITSMPLSMQAKLLRVLQDKEVERLGGVKKKKVDVKIIAATNDHIPDLIKKQKFREDLYYRLNVVNVHLPPLRERKEDILLLAEYFLKEYGRRFNKPVLSLTPAVAGVLESYGWPGNVRELKNMMERFVIMCDGTDITYSDLAEYTTFLAAAAEDTAGLKHVVNHTEKNVILDALERAGGNKAKAAKLLGVNRSTLYSKLAKLEAANEELA